MKREFLQLAKTWDSLIPVGGMFMSEKLDGVRAMWDGGVTRGMPVEAVPWANTEKHDRYLTGRICSGLWTRYGQIIDAPSAWLDRLPGVMLDGELTMGRGTFQATVGAVKRLRANAAEWERVSYQVFDMPAASIIFRDGRINNVNYKKTMVGVYDWYASTGAVLNPPRVFREVVGEIPEGLRLAQTMLPYAVGDSLAEELERVVAGGGEGLMLRAGWSIWTPARVDTLLKVKPWLVGEGVVVGSTPGKGRLVGVIGSLRLRMADGVTFDLSGFTDLERESPPPLGMLVRFKYRELSRDGVPKEARYLRDPGGV